VPPCWESRAAECGDHPRRLPLSPESPDPTAARAPGFEKRPAAWRELHPHAPAAKPLGFVLPEAASVLVLHLTFSGPASTCDHRRVSADHVHARYSPEMLFEVRGYDASRRRCSTNAACLWSRARSAASLYLLADRASRGRWTRVTRRRANFRARGKKEPRADPRWHHPTPLHHRRPAGITVAGIRNGKTLLRSARTGTARKGRGLRLLAAAEDRRGGWQVAGDNPLECPDFASPIPDRGLRTSHSGLKPRNPRGSTAVAFVCAAEPGIPDTAEFGPQSVAPTSAEARFHSWKVLRRPVEFGRPTREQVSPACLPFGSR